MPDVIIPADYGEVQIHWNGLSPMGSNPMNNFGVHFASPTDLDAFTDNCQDVIQNLINPLDSSWGVDFIRLRIGDGSGPPYAFLDVPTPGMSGTATGSSSPPNACALLAKGTASPGREGRGRMYLPGLPEGSVGDDGQIDPAFITDMTSAISDFRTAFPDMGTDDLVILSATNPIPHIVTSLVCRSVAAMQRRRLRS